jgi:hypothetical protein
MVRLQPPSRIALAWSLWLATFGCCAAGLVVELVGTRPLTAAGLAEGAAFALSFPLGFASRLGRATTMWVRGPTGAVIAKFAAVVESLSPRRGRSAPDSQLARTNGGRSDDRLPFGRYQAGQLHKTAAQSRYSGRGRS